MMDSNLRLVMGAAVVGIFLGVAGVVFGVISKNKTDELRADFSKVEVLMDTIQRVEESSTGISASATRIRRELDALRDGTQGAFDQVSNELTRLRRDLNESISTARALEQKLADLRSPPPQQPAPAPQSVSGSGDGERAQAERSAVTQDGGQVYLIRSGDTLSSVAVRHGVSLDRLMTANPDANPTRLQIGQEIIIPSP